MDKKELELMVLAMVEEYVGKPEAWEEAQVVIDKENGKVDLMEIEEAEELPDNWDVCPVMDLIEMTPDGEWIADREAVTELAENL
ncbi:MAG: hypothetical protein K2N88_05305 [Muribaculaceae bacterium]|nr:hypothetical protein [Muribaculaceae bacterium]